MYKQQLQQLSRACFVILIIVGLGLSLKYAIIYMYPFLLAAFLSFLINPTVGFLENTLKFPRAIATLSILIVLFAFIIGCIVLFITEIIQGTTYLAEKIPEHFHAFATYLEDFLETNIFPIYQKLASLFQTLDPEQQKTIRDNIEQFTANIASSGTTVLQNILLKIPSVLGVLPNSFATMTVVILATFFITKDWHTLKESLQKLLPSFATESGKQVWNHLKKAFAGFVKAQFVLVTLTGVIIFFGLAILNINHALTISFIASLIDLLPYIGTGAIFIPWIGYSFLTANYQLTIGLSILYIIVIISRQILEPKLLSASIGVNPLAILAAIFLGIKLWGILGLFIAPILLVMILALYEAGIFRQLWLFIKG